VAGGENMAKKVAIINMKGGVGKSTLCTQLAWNFSAKQNWDKKVLAIDLDPQFNASQYILGVAKYQKEIITGNRPTVWDIFEQAAKTPGLKSAGRKLTDAILPIVEYKDGARLDIITSQLELSYTLKNPSGKEHLLANFVDEIESNYDLVLVDCAPTESVLTTAAYLTADNILIPVKPEFLSTIGLPLIRQSMAEFMKLYKKKLSVTGICFNMTSGYYPEEQKSKAEVKKLASTYSWHVFEEEVPHSRSFPKGAREGSPIFTTSYARTKVSAQTEAFCEAFAKEIGL
jgi:chromosome partitioning protein